jgi:hypothetical protein
MCLDDVKEICIRPCRVYSKFSFKQNNVFAVEILFVAKGQIHSGDVQAYNTQSGVLAQVEKLAVQLRKEKNPQ